MATMTSAPPDAFIELWNSTWREREIGRTTLEATLLLALAGCGVDSEQCRVNEVLVIWTDLIRRRLAPRNPAVLETLTRCREAGIKIGLLSNAGPEVPAIFAEIGLGQLVDAPVFSAQVGAVKPDPVMYQTVCDRLGVHPHRCVFVGDGSDDELDGARRAGMAAVWLRVQSEIDAEGLPEATATWNGASISAFEEILAYL
jgi:putative hydrolase of the HAD superfamily